MTNFLTSVVRRGAGLPLPVSIRPAAGTQQDAAMPIAPQADEGNSLRAAAEPAIRAESEEAGGRAESILVSSVPRTEMPVPTPRTDVQSSPVWKAPPSFITKIVERGGGSEGGAT